MKKIQDLITGIHNIKTNEDLNLIVEAVKLKRQYLERTAVRQFIVGEKVQFTNRRGVPVGGTIRKINRKYIVVDTPVGGYRVPATMLTSQEA
tara:strand:+ start:405 stop:680 length:276 start_codon:yes stop_codon:yes gene_type:complete